MNPTNSTSAPKSRHWLLVQSRQWHKWGGLIAALFLLIVGATGIVLNYKQPIFSALGLEKPTLKAEMPKPSPQSPQPALTTGAGLAALPVSVDRALQIARAEWGDVSLERIELKAERGQMIYKVKQTGGSELWVNAADGSHFTKGQYERIVRAGADGVPVRTTDWGKILIDLHTGKIGGDVGKAVMTCAAVLLLLLTCSGVYVWLKPLLIRRESRLSRARVGLPAEAVRARTAPIQAGTRRLVEG